MAEEKTNKRAAEERSTPLTGAEEHATSRVRSHELPADRTDEQELIKKANNSVNQTVDGEGVEVQGKAVVPREKVMKRGQTKWTDEDGVLHKELNDEEVNARLADEELPEYLKLHQEVLEGADPLKATLKYQGRDKKEAFAEGKLADAEKHPRTGGLGPAASVKNEQRTEKE